MERPDYPIVDIDHHYYEPDDCCTRHLEERFQKRAVHVGTDAEGRREWRAGKRRFGFARMPIDVTLAPGELRRLFSDREAGIVRGPELISSEDPRFRQRGVRLAHMDEYGIQAALMLPSFGLSFEAELRDDPELAVAHVRAFNRWVEEDWGYAYEGRLFAPAYLSLLDLDAALAELERVQRAGARLLMIRTGPVNGRSPADPYFDPFWARINEAELPVVVHISSSGYERDLSAMWGEDPQASMMEASPLQWMLTFATRPIVDTLSALILHNLFGRFPKLKILSIENGSHWVPRLLVELDHWMHFTGGHDGTGSQARFLGGRLADKPSDLFKRHIYLAPFLEPVLEAPIPQLVELLGADHVLYGSDWPHGEGAETPLGFLEHFDTLGDAERLQILRTNNAGLLGLT